MNNTNPLFDDADNDNDIVKALREYFCKKNIFKDPLPFDDIMIDPNNCSSYNINHNISKKKRKTKIKRRKQKYSKHRK